MPVPSMRNPPTFTYETEIALENAKGEVTGEYPVRITYEIDIDDNDVAIICLVEVPYGVGGAWIDADRVEETDIAWALYDRAECLHSIQQALIDHARDMEGAEQ